MTETKQATGGAIYAALVAAQREIKPALKQANNPHLKSKYADLGSVMDACRDALHNNGFAVIQPTGHDESGHFVETVLLHSSGERLACRVPMIFAKNDMQGYGSAMTYARRYGLMTMAGIAPEDDDGEGAKGQPSNNNRTSNATPPPRQPRQRSEADSVQLAVEVLDGAISLDDLKAKWAMLPKHTQEDKRVFDAGKRRKTQLAAQEEAHEPLDALIQY